MANGRGSHRRKDDGREAGPFIALPMSVMDSPAFVGLSHIARSLLWEMARQIRGHNNGQLLASFAYLSRRGWTSKDTIAKAKRELLNAEFLFETVKGHRPNWASWYAVTWRTLDHHKRFDSGVGKAFRVGEYRNTAGRPKVEKIASLSPSLGPQKPLIAPQCGVGAGQSGPQDGAVCHGMSALPAPPRGHHLEMPSTDAAPPASPEADVVDVKARRRVRLLESVCAESK